MSNCFSGRARFFVSTVCVLIMNSSNIYILLLKSVKLPNDVKILQHECKSTATK